MDLPQIRNFLSLAATLNFTEAAHQVGISQPSLTRSIKRLEEDLGGALVYRDGRDTRLTPLGRDVQIEFMGILKLEARVRELAETRVHGERETLTIGVASTLSPVAISKYLNHVIEQLPSLTLTLCPITNATGVEAVLTGELDGCFISGGSDSHPKLSIVELFSEKLVLCCSETHRFAALDEVSAIDLPEELYVDRLACEFRSEAIEWLMDNDVLMNPRIRSGREDLIQQFVAGGEAVCLLPEFSTVASGLVRKRVTELDLCRQIRFVAVTSAGYAMALRQMVLMAERFDWSHTLNALKL
ncbi:hypothetical protein AB833_32590 [Chromatiales bacterium (ex Bugula neritina AB1)]|nr:hypothetical protein AB833_32590 [Chromatiales bacterium (ex Bugula neritina AB1)]